MGTLLAKENLIKAGLATLAALLAANVTASQTKLVQGAATFGAVLLSLQLAAKI